MTTFSSHRSYWHFASSVRREWRYIRPREQVEFLDAVVATSTTRREVLPAGSLVFRAQLGCDWPESEQEEAVDPGPRPFSPERMIPLRDRAKEGRVNPPGIPCLYVATEEETAAAEVRPWIGAYISVAQLRVKRDLVLVNCTSTDRRLMVYFEEPEPAERELAVWRDIDRAFAQPVERDDQRAEYVPTQVLAEVFREQGLDGIGYRSALGPGHNIALFQIADTDVLNCTVHYVRGIQFQLNEAANRHFVRKHYPELEQSDA